MTTRHTPQNTRQAAEQATPGDVQQPPPIAAIGQPAMMMSPDQFKALIDTCKGSDAAGDADFPGVNSVAVKLPTFWMHDPDLWFLQTEAVFASRVPAVTRDATKFNHVVTALPSEALNAIKNVIRLPVATADRYQQLKATLMTIYGKTAAEKHAELIEFASNKEPILDQKPSCILMYIQELSGDSKEAFERQVLLNRLPEAVRTTLSTSAARTNAEFAKEANRVMESYCLAHKVSTSSVSSVSSPGVEDADDQFQNVAAVYRPPPKASTSSGLCSTHAKYGSRAFTCRSAACPMRGQLQPRGPPLQQQRRPFSGNGGAGRQ